MCLLFGSCKIALQYTWIDPGLPAKIKDYDKILEVIKEELRIAEGNHGEVESNSAGYEQRIALRSKLAEFEQKKKDMLSTCWDPLVRYHTLISIFPDLLQHFCNQIKINNGAGVSKEEVLTLQFLFHPPMMCLALCFKLF